MKNTEAWLAQILRILREDRDALWHSHVNPGSGKIDDANARDALAEYDECISWLNNTLETMEVDHV